MPAFFNFKRSQGRSQGRSQLQSQGGFALIIALSLMAFVLLLLLSITTLVQVESQGANTQMQQIEAEQVALLGLQVAMGELQKAAGPDQRVTATADILSTTTPNQPHLLGVWKSFTQSNVDTTAIDYSTKNSSIQQNGDFIQWLSSGTAASKAQITYPMGAPIAPVVTLVDSETVSAASDFVSASAIEIDVAGAIGGTGKYAWQVFDESQKANLTLNQATPVTDAERITNLGTGGKPGFQIDASYGTLESLSDADREKLVSLDSSNVVSFDPVANSAFHHLTTDSKSLLVDVANGGFQKDLSLLFENTVLPTAYADRYIYSETNTPVAAAPARFGGGVNSAFAEPIVSPDPTWSLLHSHYKLYRSVSSGSSYGVTASRNARFLQGAGYDTLNNPVKDANPAFFEQQQLLPVVSNAQFIFSITPQKVTSTNSDTGVVTATLYVQFVVDTVVTLWNPYDVNLEFSDMEIEFYRFPLQLEFYRNGTLMTTEPVHIANMFNSRHLGTGVVWGGQNTIPYRARIQGASQGSTIALKPGEYKVFSPADSTVHHQNKHYIEGMVLREGWIPPTPTEEAGASVRHILKDNQNKSVGINVDGTSTPFVIAQAGDVYSVRASASKVNSSISSSGFLETNDQEIAAYLKIFQGDGTTFSTGADIDTVKRSLDQNRTQVGVIELDLSATAMASQLPTYGPNEMSKLTIPAAGEISSNIYSAKVPLLIASLRLKTEQDSALVGGQPNASFWLHNGITNPYFTSGIQGDQSEDQASHQYELTWEPMTSWNNIPTVSIDASNRGYGGSGVTPATGVNFAPVLQVPLVPATSIAQFSHAPLNVSGQAPLTTQIVGNSFNAPLIPLANKSSVGSLGTHLDHSYMANTTLFDSYFLSTATAQTQAVYGTARGLAEVIDDFVDQTQSLPNSNFELVPNSSPTVTAADYDTFAQHLYNKGAFNVNSTSEEAWALFLASGINEALPILDLDTASTNLTIATASNDTVLSRFAPLIGDEKAASTDGQQRWEGHRRLTATQIAELAEKVVEEVKRRGPFQSIAEFVNRRLEDDTATANSGALQTAIENINDLNTDFGLSAPKNNSELNGNNQTASTSDGAATQIIQADLLNRLAPSITVRGDTFRIRSYGEVTVGTQTVKAWCEAVVQRGHDFVDITDAPTTAISNLINTNQTFGRRFNIVSFRWLSESEI